jgi:cytochrome c5
MKHVQPIIAGCLIVAATLAIAQVTSAPEERQPKTAAKQARVAGPDMAADRGHEVFQQNCYRCHHAPEGFSPSISATVVKHMRVRAGLSDADAKALLKFFNP